MNSLSRWFITNPVAANLLMVAILVAGVLSLGQLRVESFPQIAPSSLVINVAYPGGTAAQIDQSITQRIEAAISGIGGIKQVVSQSSAGMASVRVRKTAAADLDKLLEDVRNQVNAIEGLPQQAEKPQVSREEFTNLAAFVIVSGPRDNSALQPIARQVELALKQHPRIAKVANLGSRQALLVIEPDLDKLQNLGLNLEQVAEAVARNSLETRSGELKNAAGRLLLRGDGYADGLQPLSRIALHSSAQGTVTLGEVASIKRDYQDDGAIVRNNGQTAIALLVSTAQQDNLLQVSEAIAETLARQRSLLPADISLTTMADMAPYIREQLGLLGDSAWQGLLIVIVLLGLFLELKLAFWVAMGIPLALAGTLSAMQVFDYSINDITLFGFILVLGILVDDAVVVGESIYAQRRPGRPAAEAALQGVSAVSVATVFGVLTTIAAFSPMLWINNELAKVLAGFSAVVIFALLFSLLESKLILPAHLCGNEVRMPRVLGRVQRGAQDGLQWFINRVYRPLLSAALEHSAATLLGFGAFILLAYGLWSTGAIRSAIFPEIPGRYLTANVDLQDGAPLALQAQALNRLSRSAEQIASELTQQYSLAEPPLVNLLGHSDGYGQIEVTAELSHEALRRLPANLLLQRWREQTGALEGAYAVSFAAAESPAGGSVLAIAALDRDLARQASQALASTLAGLPGVADVYDDGQGGQPQIRLKLNAFGRHLGLNQHHLARLAGEAFGQREIHRLLENGQETKLILRYPASARRSTEQLPNTPVFLDSGQTVRLGDVVELHVEREPEALYRRNREQVVNLYWRQNRDIQAPERTLEQLQGEIATIEARYPGVSIRAAGEFEEIDEVQDGFKQAMLLTLLLIYILLAIPLKSYWQPLLIMAVIPFGFAGAIFGHGLMGLPISLLSMFGMLAMTGIVVNDSLVLITHFNQHYRAGMGLREALINSASSRFRAIFLTTVTTVCGLLPLLSETSEQAQYLKPAAVSLVFGELFATAITLVLIPVLLGLSSRRQVQPVPAAATL
ncbi:Multidrug efflux pump subunit AcrB [Atopomonas hussainii]|uniref:Multidrug efflux pump subunit AcrB n=1 Tax=Atopomonas hussainii TaxID=1429083 RepID=A0A1H7KA12_9GAMM|nr:efflux RND transporter permease subunit [Atopomonas hussainii]SEK83340.1 Multidrug efflux pump subunit AcrB [Atopomonas hussainii]